MSVLFILIPLSLIMGMLALLFFSISVNTGQFDVTDKEISTILDIEELNT